MNLNFKKSLDSINQYLSLIIIVPALLGGLWQIIELSRISFSFIRFFSVSQIIPDGLLILLFVLTFGVSSLILIWFIERYSKQKSDLKNEKENRLHGIIFILLFIVCCVVIFFFNKFVIENIEHFINLVIFFPINILICSIAYTSYSQASNEFRSLTSKMFSYAVFELVQTIFICAYLIIFIFLIAKFHEVFFLPNELRNIDNLICKIEKVEPYTNHEILYTNDKYIFVRLHKFSKNKNGKINTSE
ncbi:MAG TPA: hypothetical protein VLB74_07670, partial [Flavobacterium sp.]|uniref:hypothetical protein n=1 Tax=Flavobacterium sp. TaxID=239 RepID=UPI002C568BC3